MRYQGTGFVTPAGMLTGIKARAEGRCSHASNADAAAAAVEPVAVTN